jgi:hypothetical protein
MRLPVTSAAMHHRTSQLRLALQHRFADLCQPPPVAGPTQGRADAGGRHLRKSGARRIWPADSCRVPEPSGLTWLASIATPLANGRLRGRDARSVKRPRPYAGRLWLLSEIRRTGALDSRLFEDARPRRDWQGRGPASGCQYASHEGLAVAYNRPLKRECPISPGS